MKIMEQLGIYGWALDEENLDLAEAFLKRHVEVSGCFVPVV